MYIIQYTYIYIYIYICACTNDTEKILFVRKIQKQGGTGTRIDR